MTDDTIPELYRFLRALGLFGSFFAAAALSVLTVQHAVLMLRRRAWWRWGYVVFFVSGSALLVLLTETIADTAGLPPSRETIEYLICVVGLTVGGGWIVWNEGNNGGPRKRA